MAAARAAGPAQGSGSTLLDVDGRSYADFCLGDTGAMFGHSPLPVANALSTQASRGLTCMLPTEQTARAGQLLAERFNLPFWQLTQTATDANRAVLRWARALTERRRILVFDGCYHGSLEDTLVRLDQGHVVTRPGQIGNVADFASHARVVEFNDLAALEAALTDGEVACLQPSTGSRPTSPGRWNNCLRPSPLVTRAWARRCQRTRLQLQLSSHFEHPVSGADANPYLVAATVLAGVHTGITDKLDPGPPVTGNGYERGTAASLSRDWLGAIEAAESSIFLRAALGDEFLRAFIAIKTQEWDKYNALVPSTDHDWYLDSV